MQPIPTDARRRLVQAASEVSASILALPSGLVVLAAIENLMSAMDTYNEDVKATGQG
jgi:hypothetical protein